MNDFIALLKKPKLISIFFFILLMIVINFHWQYIGFQRFSNAYCKFKIDRFTGFKYIDYYPIFSSNSDNNNIGYGTYPAYNSNMERFSYYTAFSIFYIESIMQFLLVIANIGWIAYAWIFK